jgi:hypothetical protein
MVFEWEENKTHQATFFFIKDRVDVGEMRIIDCPTDNMWADVLTKPLQGAAFNKMRAQLIVRMCDCCLEGIEPCKCKGNGHQWMGNQVFRLAEEEKKKKKKWDLWKRSPKTFWGI